MDRWLETRVFAVVLVKTVDFGDTARRAVFGEDSVYSGNDGRGNTLR